MLLKRDGAVLVVYQARSLAAYEVIISLVLLYLWLLVALEFFDHSPLRLFVDHDLVGTLAIFGNKRRWTIGVAFRCYAGVFTQRAHHTSLIGTLRESFAAATSSAVDALAE